MAGGALGFPFTWAQWKELQRQALIYKYMMASVPVPPNLLPQPPIASHSFDGGYLSIRFTNSNNKDGGEPGRCKRTDGKKWRCSRDVAPQQKYCERHLHRGRPRSRKPVEVVDTPFNSYNNNKKKKKKTRLGHHTDLPPILTTTLPNPNSPTAISSPHLVGSALQLNGTPLFLDDKSDDIEFITPVPSYWEPSRGSYWTMEGEMLATGTSEKQLLLQTNLGLTTEGHRVPDASASFFLPDSAVEPPYLIPYSDLLLNQRSGYEYSTSFLNPDLLCLETQAPMETPRGFIDAWSNENPTPGTAATNNKNESSVSSSGSLSPSSLTLSMAVAAGEALDEEMGQIQMVGSDVKASGYKKPPVSSRLSPASWVDSAPGGPLAEALRSVAVSSDSTSSFPCNGDPSWVPPPRRTMLSLSDSSGCTSPAVAAPTATLEAMPFQWLS